MLTLSCAGFYWMWEELNFCMRCVAYPIYEVQKNEILLHAKATQCLVK